AAGWLASDLWTYTWSEADRSKHIVNEITSSEKITTDDIWAITERVSYDDVSATFIIPYLVEAMSSVADGSKVKLALDIVENWDREWRLEANGEYGSAELIVENWTKRLFENVFKDDIGDEKYAMYAATNNPNNRLGPSMGSSVGSKVILRNMTSLLSNTNVYDFFNGEEPGKILSRSFTEAIDTLVIKHGSDLTQWALPAAPMIWKPYNFRGVPQASEGSLVSLPAYMNRGSENNFFVAKAGRFVAFDVNPPGQSGFVAPDGTASAHSQDQMTLYSTYGTKALPFTLEEIKAAAVEIETLNDESAAYGVKVGAGL
ncbi:MAG: penicillin amidase, partial [Arenicella sp.]